MTTKQFLSRTQAAELLADRGYPWKSKATLAKLASEGGGPPFHRCGGSAGGRTLYDQSALLAWAEERAGPELRSTSDTIAAPELRSDSDAA